MLTQYSLARPKQASSIGVWCLGLGETIIWANIFYVFAAMLLPWERDLAWQKSDLTLGLTLAILAAALASPVAGRMIDAGFGRWVLGVGAAAGAAGLTVLSMVVTPLQYWLVWTFIGAAQGFCLYEPCFSVVTRAKGAAARPAITRITLLGGFASAICFLLAAALLDMTDWRSTLLIFAAMSAFIAAPSLFIGAALLEGAAGDALKPAAKSENRAALLAALRRPQFWLIALAFPMMALNHGVLLNHIMPLLAEKGVAETSAVLVASTIGPMQVAGRAALMAMEKRVNSLLMMTVCFGGVCVASLLLLGAGVSPVFAFAFAALQGAAYGLTSILKPAITADLLGRVGYGSIAGWLALPYLFAFAFAPYLGALVWEVGGYDLVVPMTAGMAAFGVICTLALAATGKAKAT